jgi:glycosyltransferase involved in cell wall biosynthesis
MKIVVSVGGRFHAFYLAQQLLKRNFLVKLITSYPKFEVSKYGIPKEKVGSVLIKEILWRGWDKFFRPLGVFWDPSFFINDFYDKLASGKLVPCDICVAWSSFGLRTIRKAKKFGALGVIDHGSAHIKYHEKILREEYDILGIRPNKINLVHPGVLKKEVAEYAEADYIFVPSSFSKKTFLDEGVAESKVIQVPYGVNLKEFTPVPKKDSVFRVVYAGGMTIQKGVHYLLRAFSELNIPNSELLLIGGFNDEIKPFFKKYSGKFKYIGKVSQKELTNYYSQSSVFVLNSIQDGFGMVIIQAMACGLPVIATENTGGPDIIRDGTDGFIIPIRSVDMLKEKLYFFYKNPEMARQMGDSARKRVSSGFTWDDYGNNISKKYEEILIKKQRDAI